MTDPRDDPRFSRVIERAVESLRARMCEAAEPELLARSIFDIRRRDFLSAISFSNIVTIPSGLIPARTVLTTPS